ncbi:MAG: hypothetical protein NUW01_13500 [Gemmatimonadaceae bacterium]|nr:hypothetical protein [Gemmatimonadaceae bacterium]
MDRQTYTPERISEALQVVSECRGSLSEASRRLSIPVMTLSQWSRGVRRQKESEKGKAERETVLATTKLRLSKAYGIAARKALNHSMLMLPKATAHDAARMSALYADHMVSLAGGAFRQQDGPGVTVSLAQYFTQALPTTKTVTVTPIEAKDDTSVERQ